MIRGFLYALLLLTSTHFLAAKWSPFSTGSSKKVMNRVNPTQFDSTDPACAALKDLNIKHKQLEKESFYESMTLLTLLTKKDIKARLPQIPPNVLKKVIEEMQSTYVWMQRASTHPKTPEDVRTLLKDTLLPRSKYLVNAIAETLHHYDIGARGSRSPLGHAGTSRKTKKA